MKVTYQQIADQRKRWMDKNAPYEMVFWNLYNYKILNKIMYKYKTGKGRTGSFNDIIIGADTETSKKEHGKDIKENHVVAWTISLRAFDRNIVTLWGRTPSEMMDCFELIFRELPGDDTSVYFFNLNYDWCFLRKFFFKKFGYPDNQLNTKPHYPLFIKWKDKGFTLKDALMLAQRKLEKWAEDMNVEHQKAVGSWDYDKIRTQHEEYTKEELHYIENDTLALCECIEATLKAINKTIYSIPYTATGIIRGELKKIGKENHAHDWFLKQALDWPLYNLALRVYHGGFTHANRFLVNMLIDWHIVKCKDFVSSYPYCMLSEKYPSSKFMPYKNCDPELIMRESKFYCFMFRLDLLNFRLKDPYEPMPYLQYYKMRNTINVGPENIDNGRVVSGGYCEIYLNEVDLQIVMSQYTWDRAECCEVYYANKDYLPRWLTDYVYQRYVDKCHLKGGDPVLYLISKAKLNCIYGLTVQRSVMDEIIEFYTYDPEDPAVYDTKSYTPREMQELYDRYVNKKDTILPYQIGVWVTAYAARNLILGLGSCIDDQRGADGKRTGVSSWYYSDTDSIYSDSWNERRVEMYNTLCKQKLLANGYGPVKLDGKEYWLGIAEDDKEYTEFKYQGAKRYCGRSKKDGKLHITVAGVPKKGAECLEDDINNFVPDFIFDGSRTGKLTHYYIYAEDIHIDEEGNEIGDSIDLQPCDYCLDQTERWEYIEQEEITVPIYQ